MLEALSLLLVLAHTVEPLDMAADIAGPYCARVNKCCPGRLDECSVPILGTLCYCDTFCNRTVNPDCCPDYLSHCHGDDYGRYVPFEGKAEWTRWPPIPLTEGCFFNGQYYPARAKIRNNCNDCQCIQMNRKAEMLCSRDKCMIDAEVLELANRGSAAASSPSGAPLGNDIGAGGGGGGGGRAAARWAAANYTEFWNRTLEEGITLRLGTLAPSDAVRSMNPLRHSEPAVLPRDFDARTAWPGALAGVQDQGWCGASWALSTAAVASDRYAIMSMGKEAPKLAAQHLLDCNNRRQHGCSGGHLDRAWFFTRKFGLVPESCYPWTGQADQCRVPKKATLQTARCPLRALRSRKARTELYRMGPAYRLASEHDIMREILRSGPVQATMQVYHDLFAYRSGVYAHLPVAELERTGYHSVRIVGWGEEGGVRFWIVANSWGQWWGEQGFFRIRRGTNECKIEDLVLAAWAHTHVQKELDNTISM